MHCANTRRSRRAAALLAAILFMPLAHSQTGGNADLDRVRGDIVRLRKRLEDVRRLARTAEEQLNASNLELGIRSKELDVALELQAQVDREKAGVEGEVAQLVPRIAQQKQHLARRLIALYRLGSLSYVRVLLSLEDQRDPAAALSMLGFLVSHDGRMIDRFREAREQLVARQLALEERKRALVDATRIVEQRRQAVVDARAENERLLARLRAEESGSEEQLAGLEEKARRLERLVDLLSRQNGAAIAATNISNFRGALAWPVDGKVIESFGRQRNAKFATYTMNNGLKIASEARTPVRSVFQGTVLFSQWFKGYGNLIILDHGNRVFSLYGNVVSPTVTPGDRIVTGQAIAGVGESEDAEPAYLYFEIRQDNKPEDPREWLR